MSAFLSPIRTCRTGHQSGFSRPPSMAERRAKCSTGAKGSYVAADAARPTVLACSPFAKYKAQSLWLLTHSHDTSPSSAAAVVWKTLLSYSHDTSPPTSGLPCVRGHSLIHMITSPTSAAAVFGRHCSFIHTIPASHQRLPCVEDSALSLFKVTWKPLLQSLTHSPVVKRPPPQNGR